MPKIVVINKNETISRRLTILIKLILIVITAFTIKSLHSNYKKWFKEDLVKVTVLSKYEKTTSADNTKHFYIDCQVGEVIIKNLEVSKNSFDSAVIEGTQIYPLSRCVYLKEYECAPIYVAAYVISITILIILVFTAEINLEEEE